MNQHSSFSRLFALLSLVLFVLGLLVPFGIAAAGSPRLAVGFGVTSETLSIIFGVLGWAHTPARVSVICNMLLLVGLGGVAAIKWHSERHTEVVAWLRVRQSPVGETVEGGNRGDTDADYEEYRRAQVIAIKDPEVLAAAIDLDGIAELDAIRGQADPVAWLADQIKVVAPEGSEVIQVRMGPVVRGPEAQDAARIVNAVTEAYLSNVVNKERPERIESHDTLVKKYKEKTAELQTRLAEDKNPDNANADIEARRNEIQQLQAAINQMVAQLATSELDIVRPKRVELIEKAESQN